jgi:hypothetical protein
VAIGRSFSIPSFGKAMMATGLMSALDVVQ